MKFKPLHDRVLVKRVQSDEKTAGGIIIPDTAKEKPQEGEVMAVGPGAKNEDGKLTPMDVKVGDIVLFGKWSGTEVKIDGQEYSIMKEADIMGISKAKK
jgi:chaperonin GroES